MLDLRIRTDRLNLRPFVPEDAVRVRELIGAWAVTRMLSRVPFPYPPGHAEDWIGTHVQARARGENFPFAITLHNRLIGCIGLQDNPTRGQLGLGYWLAVSYWGFGYTTEAARAVLAFGFGWLGLAAIGAQYYEENAASGRILAKLGFVETSRGLHPCLARNTPLPGIEVELTRESWAANATATRV